jgi:hypothetical protein
MELISQIKYMKFFYIILVISVLLLSCNDSQINESVESDSARAFATADSIAAAKALADTAVVPMDTIGKIVK